MTDHMPGPDLDRLVAKAMGWKLLGGGTESWWAPPAGRLWGRNRTFPCDYSTKFGAQTQEMLDWLEDEEVAAVRYCGQWHVDWRNPSQHVMLGEVRGDVRAEAPTLPHALSLLVLKVAEWRKQQNAAPAPDSMGGA